MGERRGSHREPWVVEGSLSSKNTVLTVKTINRSEGGVGGTYTGKHVFHSGDRFDFKAESLERHVEVRWLIRTSATSIRFGLQFLD